MTIPVIPNRSRKGILIHQLASTSSTKPPDKSTCCCICKSSHGLNRWRKCCFTLTEFGIKLASLMMERKIEGNICCNSAYVVLFDYYHSVEGNKKATLLPLNKINQPPNIKEVETSTSLQPILPKNSLALVTPIVSPFNEIDRVEKEFKLNELTQKQKRENTLLNINDPMTCSLNLKQVFECFEEINPASFVTQIKLTKNKKYPLHIRYKVALLFAKYDTGSQSAFDVMKLVGNIPEFGYYKISDSMSHDTVLRCVVEMALCVKAAISLLLSESSDLLWSCDETDDSQRRFLVFTIHGLFRKQQWHYVVKLNEIIEGNASKIVEEFQELLKEVNSYQSALHRKNTKSYHFVGFCSDNASVNTGCKSGILALFNKLRREEYKELDPYGVTELEDCVFLSCVDHTAALASKLAHKKISKVCDEYRIFSQTNIPQSYQSIIHYITKTISSKFKGDYQNQYKYFQDIWKLKFKSMPYVDDIRYCSVDIVANLIIERLFFFRSIKRVICDKKLVDVLTLLDRKEIIMMLCVSSSMWTSIYSRYMRCGAVINSTTSFLQYLELFTNIISNPNNYCHIFKVTIEITPELFCTYYSSTKSITLNIPSQITCQIQLANQNYSLIDFEEKIGKTLLKNKALESGPIILALEECSSSQDVDLIDISSINCVQEGKFNEFGLAVMSESLTSMVFYIDKNNNQIRNNRNYSEFVTVTNRLCERSFGTVKYILDDNLHTRPIIIESIILIRQFPMDIDVSNLSQKLDFQTTARSLLDSQLTRKKISSTKAIIELKQAQEAQRKLNDKELNQLNGEITMQYLKKCGITIKTTEKAFTNKWYAVVIDELRKYYNKQGKKNRKKITFRKKSDCVGYLSNMASEEEHVLWRKGLPSQSSSQSVCIIEEPSSQ